MAFPNELNKLTTNKSGMSSADLGALLRERESASMDERQLREIYSYLDTPGNDAFAYGPSDPGSESGMGSTGLGITRNPIADNEGGGSGELQRPEFNFDPGRQFREGITLHGNSPTGEGSSGFHYNVDGSKFPQTRFGDVNNTAPVEWNTNLYNPRLRYEDDNYGDITHGQNVNSQSWSDYTFPALMAIMSGGMGLLPGASTLAMSLPGLMQGLSNGNGINWGSLAQILGQQFGVNIPSWASGLANFGINQLTGPGKK